MYTLWVTVNSIWHGRSQMCEKCFLLRPGSGELGHHRFNKSGVCTLCTYSK
jgi:hypothetical protein